MTDYNDGNWHGWNGGECPVHPKTVIEYLWNGSSGVHHEKEVVAGRIGSTFRNRGKFYIIAFRVVKEHKEPREFWIKTYGDGCLSVSTKHRHGTIHVREVME